jgi:hypothetical protein
MVRLFFLSFFIFFASCSHHKPSTQVKTFVQSFQDQFEPHDPSYAQVYERYLASVETIYKEDLKNERFRSYLDSLNNNYQILAQQEKALPGLYKEQTGRVVASDDSNFRLFKTKEMTTLSDKLFAARELKIKDEAGEGTYEKLKENYVEFVEDENAKQFGFPL